MRELRVAPVMQYGSSQCYLQRTKKVEIGVQKSATLMGAVSALIQSVPVSRPLFGVQKHVDGNDFYYFTGSVLAPLGMAYEIDHDLSCMGHRLNRYCGRIWECIMISFLLLIALWLSLCLNLYFWDRLKGAQQILKFHQTAICEVTDLLVQTMDDKKVITT